MKAIRLRTEYLENPIGIDIASPRLFWNCEGGITQTAYQVAADVNGETVWDSGKVESSSMRCDWGGKALGSRDIVGWHVRLWDENDSCGDWNDATFELGLLKPTDWQATWITGDYSPKMERKLLRAYMGETVERDPVDCFKKVFIAKGFVKARLYITACGLYEARLGGQRVGDFVLAPGHTDYRVRVQYQTYDVTELLHEGENVLTIMLADGWYRGSTGGWGLLCEYGTETKLLAKLELTDASGKITTVCTDGTWSWSNDGPLRFADNQDGEIVDAAMSPSYAGKAKATSHTVVPTASNNVPVTENETFAASVINTPSGKTVLDFGQNIAGYLSFNITTKAGQRVHLRFGELIDNDGEFTQKNIQTSRKGRSSPLQQVEYICKEGKNEYKTTFAVFGFQYVLVETDATWRPEDFTAIAVYSKLERTGYFESSNALLGQFVENTVWSAKNNFLDVPTDCPTRERHGWSGDIQIFCKSAGYLFDFMPFAKKYLNDLYDCQPSNGCLPQIAPPGGTDFFMKTMDGSVGWADAGVLMPLVLWKLIGDARVLEEYYERMKKYARFMMRRCSADFSVKRGQSYGEWAEPREVFPNKMSNMVLPHPEESTAYTSYVMTCMEEIAKQLGKSEDVALYKKYADGTKKAYQKMRRKEKYTLDTDRQARLVRPLYMKLLDKNQTDYAKKRLLKALDNYGWRLGTGFLSTPLILYVLADYDLDAAYRLLENEEIPGWLSMPKNGATTIWEDWEGKNAQAGIASLNHYSKGAVCEWLFSTMCGITIAGENDFAIAPQPGGRFTSAKASYQSIYGKVESGWVRKGGNTTFTIAIPSGCTAHVSLPNGDTFDISTGVYHYDA